jgi:hypothetical protein
MNKTLLTIILLLLIAASNFIYGQGVKLGIQGGYATEIDKAVIGVVSEIFIIDQLSFAPSFNYYLPPYKRNWGPFDDKHELTINYWEFNADMHGYAVKNESVSVYGIFGLNFITMKTNLDGKKDSERESGANLGLGLISGDGFIEAKYETVGTGQFVFLVGFRTRLGKSKRA